MHKILNKKLTKSQFIISQTAILIISLLMLGSLYYVVNIQYQKENQPFAQGPVTTKPKSLRIDLDQPDNDTLTFQKSIIVSGKSGPNMTVLITTDSEDVVIKSDLFGKFSSFIDLDEGINHIKVVVFDVTGDSRVTERTVYYSKEKL